jgi:hypothetical protein
VNAAVVKVHTSLTRMHFPSVWKYCAQQWIHNIAKEVIRVLTVLLSHQIDDVKFIDSPNNDQHELLCPDLLLDFLMDLIAR